MKNQQLQAIIHDLERWKKIHDECKRVSDEVMRLFGSDALNQGPLNAMWRAFDLATNMTGEKLGDEGTEWLDWFCYENNMGEKGLRASNSAHQKMKPVRTLRDLAKLIVKP
jgi:hypothetical protein